MGQQVVPATRISTPAAIHNRIVVKAFSLPQQNLEGTRPPATTIGGCHHHCYFSGRREYRATLQYDDVLAPVLRLRAALSIGQLHIDQVYVATVHKDRSLVLRPT